MTCFHNIFLMYQLKFLFLNFKQKLLIKHNILFFIQIGEIIMKCIVQKYGGTSVADIDKIKLIAIK